MEVFRIQIKPQADIERHQAFRKQQHHCPICDTSLEFEISAGPTAHQILEKAKCLSCDLEIRTEVHSEH